MGNEGAGLWSDCDWIRCIDKEAAEEDGEETVMHLIHEYAENEREHDDER